MSQKISPWVWVAGGCGCLIVVILVVVVSGGFFVAKKAGDFAAEFEENPGMAGLKMMVRMNPELEMGEVDEDNETVTVRNTKTGEEVTFSFKEIKEGKFSILTDEGETTLDFNQEGEGGSLTVTQDGEETFRAGTLDGALPDWVPVYPGATVAEQGVATSTQDGQFQNRTLSTTDDFKKVVDWYQGQMEDAGFEVQRSVTEATGGSFAILGGEDKARGRTLTVQILAEEEGGSTVQLQVVEKT